jgi:8-oxo-dGTP pyrophosphatase MutT (NUDIX family)
MDKRGSSGVDAAMQMALAYRVRRTVLRVLRWRTRGVKVMAFDAAGRVLLVRHAYGRGDLWMLPGGGIARGEKPADAARREVREEVGCALSDVLLLGVFEARSEGRRDRVTLFRARTDDVPAADGREIAEARFFAPDALPDAASPATRRRVEEVLGMRQGDGRW